jgi:hypothetical protein
MTPSIIIAVLIATGIWATVASIIAHTRGRDYHLMAERHNSVVNALRKTEVEHEALKIRKTEAAQRHTEARNAHDKAHLAALERIEQLKIQLNAIGVRRDPKTGRMVSNNPKKVIFDAFNSPEVIKRGAEMAAFDAMNLCDEVKANAVTDIAPKLQVYRSKVLNIGFDATKGFDVVTHDEAYSPCEVPNEPYVQRSIYGGDSIVHDGYCYTTKRPERKQHTLKHGMTVKNPTPEEAMEIFAEAKRLGITVFDD